ncbi:MAG: DUF3306 domain-containing protein [Hyphomicrobiaceae bacterium]|nr:DUF3306 domain-containing protein [Hyphomicrobiaceae bacterium]
MSTPADNGFLSRWSRLKREARNGGAEEAGATGEVARTDYPADNLGVGDTGSGAGSARHLPRDGQELAALDGQSVDHWPNNRAPGDDRAPGDTQDCDPPPATLRDFKDFDFEGLDFESDYTQFMGRDVSHDARNKALRKLWLSNPVLANMDGLDDYCEDYTDAAMVPIGGVKTAYKLGRGFLSDEEVAEWEALGRPEVAADADADADTGSDADTVADNVTAEGEATTVASAADATAEDADGAEPPADEFGEAGDASDTAVPATSVASADDHASAGGAGAACAVAVRLEEQAAIDAFDVDDAGGADDRSSEGGRQQAAAKRS